MTGVHFRVLLLAISTAVAAACGGNASMSPTAPSVTGTGASGAVIIGQVSGMSAPITTRDSSGAFGIRETSGALGTFDTLATSSITVKITGTNISTTTDGQGQFTLTGVPPGDVQLEFSGQGTNAKIVISGVSAQDEIRISITLNGNNAHVDSERRNRREDRNNNQAEVKGAVAGLSGTCPSVTFTVQGTKVMTTASTGFDDITCARVQNGMIVEVNGQRGADGAITAARVDLDDDRDETEVKGAVSGLSGSCPSLTFTVRGAKVTTTANTTFEGVTCARVQNGTIVEVKGPRQGDGTVAATRVELDD